MNGPLMNWRKRRGRIRNGYESKRTWRDFVSFVAFCFFCFSFDNNGIHIVLVVKKQREGFEMKCPADVVFACDKQPECVCGFCRDHCVCGYNEEGVLE